MAITSDLSRYLDKARSAAYAAGELLLDISNQHDYEVQLKRGMELVTTADLKSEGLIRDHLARAFPLHRFLSEEQAMEGAVDVSGWVWIVDPLDGTANFTHGHPYVSISIALVLDGEPRVGVVHAPFLNETYTAVFGEGARCNDSPIQVSQVSELRAALIGTGFPHERSKLDWPMERIRRLVANCQDVRRTASPALDICYVASGRLDGHCESLAPWDIAAASLIATEAGAQRANLASWSPSWPPPLQGEDFLVASPGIFQQLCELLKP